MHLKRITQIYTKFHLQSTRGCLGESELISDTAVAAKQ